MSEGKIEQIDSPQEVFRRPANKFVAEFVGSNNIFDGSVTSISDGQALVATEIGDVAATIPTKRSISVGHSIELVVSADTIEISESPSGELNEFQCVIVSEEFIGSVIGLLVEMPNGCEIRIQKHHTDIARLSVTSGSNLWIRWSPKDVYILPSPNEPAMT